MSVEVEEVWYIPETNQIIFYYSQINAIESETRTYFFVNYKRLKRIGVKLGDV
jgi:hypothetical protein